MPRTVRIAAVQAAPHSLGDPLANFAAEVLSVVENDRAVQFIVFPELHLFGTESGAPATLSPQQRRNLLREAAVPLDGELIQQLGDIARSSGVWLLPGGICELAPNGGIFNTALVFSPTGTLIASYRKIFSPATL